MSENNLYAPPKANLIDVKTGECTRDGKLVVVAVGSDLPPRCIVCNAPLTSPIKSKKLYWHNPWIYLLFLINIFIYLVVAVIARKTVKVSAGLCEEHASRRKRRILSLLGGAAVSLVAAVMSLTHELDLAAFILFILAFIFLVSAGIAGRKLYPRKITKKYARLAGCKEPFLASLE